ncbi:potassium channel family protein [Bythopirellula goksoeyrii]|uniref:Inner membrane protein YbaL n=1 Tax=Bythopirellula goksoeyrii TaxID=1400387 RepID=A0A5B9Q7H5_9BACT|nr:potassium channel protein [Bythopirellula goksoeyrii]QEG34984.1 Inner membrane protein YbaL [Bythopirellula goksoeyrii]
MNPALNRARRGALFLGLVCITSILSYHLWFNKPLLESIYWTVITVAGVGYSQSPEPDVGSARQFLSIIVIVFGMVSMAYTLAMFIQAIVEGQIDRALGANRMLKRIDKLENHVIICGFGRVGQNLSHRLARHNVPFLIIDPSADCLAEARAQKFLTLEGLATEEDVLVAAGIERAKTIVISVSSDAESVFLTLTARNMNPSIHILARGEHPQTEKKLLQAGANEVILPAVIGAERMAEKIVNPSAAEPFRFSDHYSGLNAELDEFQFTAESPFVGQTIGAAESQHQAMIVALRKATGETVFNPANEEILYPGDTVVVMGPEADLEKFYETCVEERQLAVSY